MSDESEGCRRVPRRWLAGGILLGLRLLLPRIPCVTPRCPLPTPAPQSSQRTGDFCLDRLRAG